MEVAKSDPGNSLSGAGSTSDSAAKTIRQVGSTDQAKGEVDSLFTDTFGNPELPTVKYRSVFIPDRRTMGWCVCDPKLLSLISKPSENTNLTQEAADEMSDAVEYMLRIVSHLKQYTRKEYLSQRRGLSLPTCSDGELGIQRDTRKPKPFTRPSWRGWRKSSPIAPSMGATRSDR